MKKLIYSLSFIVYSLLCTRAYAACVGPYCYDDTGAYISNLHVSSVTFVGGSIQGSASSGGSGTPAGSDTQIQFNNSNSFGASNKLTWDGDTFTADGDIVSTVTANIGTTGGNANFISGNRMFLTSAADLTASAQTNMQFSANNQIVIDADDETTGLPQITLNPAQDLTFDSVDNGKIQFNVNPNGLIVIQDVGPSLIEMTSNSQGLRLPQVSTNSIVSPVAGIVLFTSDTLHFMGYNGSAWKQLDN